jgi:CHAT domain-containing protein
MAIRILIVLILLVPVTVSAQVPRTPPIKNEDDLVSALLLRPTEGPASSAVLRDHSGLVTKTLFDKLISQADGLSGRDSVKALVIYGMARETAEQIRNKKLLAFSFYKIGALYFQQGNLSSAKQSYLQSKQALEQEGRPSDLVVILSQLANVCLNQDALQEAKEYSQQSIAIANSASDKNEPLIGPIQYGIAVSWSNLGDLAKGEGHFDEALAYFQKALEYFRSLGSKLPLYKADVADSLAEIGRVYRVKGDHLVALRYFDQALEIAKALKARDKLAAILNSIGVLYIEQNDYLKASEYTNHSLSIYRSLGDRFEVATLLINQGVINQRQGKYDDARRSFKESLENSDGLDAPDSVIAAHEGIGAAYQEQGDFRAALEWLDKALVIAYKTGNMTRQAELLWRSGEAYYLKGDFPKAVLSTGGAAELASQLHLPILSYLALTAIGKYYLAEDNYDLAFQTLSQAVEQVEALRTQVAGQEQEHQLFFENKVASYGLLVELLVKENKPVDALLFAERAKGRVLLDVLHDGKADLVGRLTPAENDEARRLNMKTSDLNERIRSEQAKTRSDANLLNQFYAKRESARLEYESFQNSLYSAHPDLNIRRGRTTTLNLEGIRDLTTDKKTAYLEFVVTKERIYLFALTRNPSSYQPELKVYPIAIRPEVLLRKVDQFHDQLASLHPDYTANARELYGLLIAPAVEQLQGADTLCIVPDGFLWNLPFQALMPTNDRFLLEDLAIYYAPSLSVLREMAKKKRDARDTNSLIAFGNPVVGKDEQHQVELCPLPEAENEVGSIAKTVGPEARRVFIGRDATEKEFKARAPGYSMIHLATHGVIDNRNPLYSHLLLTKTEGELENDGMLEGHEIMNMRLNADLVVLSGCETANGRIAPGEGVIGMSWAFFVAGTRSVLVSQWKVDSASTSQLMVGFYQDLNPKRQESSGKLAKALQSAALRLMKDDDYAHPFYWASFVLVGTN